MRDPLPEPLTFLVDRIQPLAESLGLSTLPLHAHEVVATWAIYHVIYSVVSPIVSTKLFPKVYPHLSARTRVNWNVHFTSLIQSAFITSFALFVIWKDEERNQMDLAGRIWGYTGAIGSVQACAAGYFFWDLIVSSLHLNVLGPGSLAHAISALVITSLGFRPFANYYGLNFVLYELSTPFLNIHWFFDKLNMTGSRIQLYNGIILLATFFGGRVVWGNYQSFRIYADVWNVLRTPGVDLHTLKDNPSFAYRMLTANGSKNADAMTLPTWLVFVYLGGNTILNFLNAYWFAMMIKALRKRFSPSEPNVDKIKANLKKVE